MSEGDRPIQRQRVTLLRLSDANSWGDFVWEDAQQTGALQAGRWTGTEWAVLQTEEGDVCESDPSSPESVDLTSDSPEPDSSTSSSPSPTPTGEPSSPPAGPESPSTKMSETLAVDLRNGTTDDLAIALQSGGMGDERGLCINALPHLTSFPEMENEESSPTEPQTFDWQMDGGNDKSWKGKARSWIHDKPGRARALTSNKTLAVWIPPEEEPMESSTKAYVKAQKAHDPDDCERWEESDATNTLSPRDGSAPATLISSAADSPAKTCPSPDDEQDSPANGPGSSMNSPGSLSLFDPDGFSSRTYPVSSLATAVGTSEQSLERWPNSGTAWHGGLSTHVSSECRSDDDGCSSSEPSLTAILEQPQSVPAKYSLSARAAQGILRRAERRGRTLPSHLYRALEQVARTTTTAKADDS